LTALDREWPPWRPISYKSLADKNQSYQLRCQNK
jgi:hypothetical protein